MPTEEMNPHTSTMRSLERAMDLLQVLDGLHLGAASGNSRRQPRIGHGLGRHRDIDRLRQVDSAEHDARIGRGRPQRELHALTAVQAHANGAGNGFERSLWQHGLHFRSASGTGCRTARYAGHSQSA